MNYRLSLPGFIVIIILSFTESGHGQQSRSLLHDMTNAISEQQYPNLHSVLISKNGTINYEQYFNGFDEDSLHDSRSSFKSITSLLLGIALDNGFIKNINTPVHIFFPEDTSLPEEGNYD